MAIARGGGDALEGPRMMYWVAFAAFLTPQECDAFVEANRPYTDREVQCVIIEPEKPPVRPRARPEPK